MSLFDDSRVIWVFLRKWVVSENQSFLNEGAIITHLIDLVLGGQVPRLSHGQFDSLAKTLKGVLWAIECWVAFFDTLTKVK